MPREKVILYESPHGIGSFDVLWLTYTLLPIITGVDKLFGFLTDWNKYQAPIFYRLFPGHYTFTYLVGIIEIVVGMIVLLYPRVGALAVMFWLWAVIINLLILGGHYDMVVMNFALSMGALALHKHPTRI